jgi:hypothetical protein
MAFELNGQPISIDRSIIIGNVVYPHLRDAALRAELGVVEVADEPTYDQRFYWSVGNPKLLNDREEVDEEGNPLYEKVLFVNKDGDSLMVDSDKRLVTKGLKSQWIAQVKQTAGSLLAATDWMVIRKAERGVAVPDSVALYRADVIVEADRIETAIKACTTVEELIAVVGAQNWPKAN